MDDIYDPDDVGLLNSPLLRPMRPNLDPTPCPIFDDLENDGFISDDYAIDEVDFSLQSRTPFSVNPYRHSRRVASKQDAVLINLLGGGKAVDVARTAATELLASDDEMSVDNSHVDVRATRRAQPEVDSNSDLAALAMGALKIHAQTTATFGDNSHLNIKEENSPEFHSNNDLAALAMGALKVHARTDATTKGMPNKPFTVPERSDELAPLKENSPKSKKSYSLSSIAAQLGKLTQLADAVTANVTAKYINSKHRPSISDSPSGPPLFQVTQATQPGSHTSPPISPIENSRRELPSPRSGYVTAASPYYYNNPRRPSQASDGPPYPAGTQGDYANSSVETLSTDSGGLTPANIPSGGIDRMSIDGIANPNPQIGGFVCTYPGCNAQPFQTQYLLNCHANVHSSNRPYYCPVKGCLRCKGGKGFKRKNEMIRHGLVHEAPGYVCPYCQDPEHKYPRPDNLQRSVSQLKKENRNKLCLSASSH
jgi:hypothetical protein